MIPSVIARSLLFTVCLSLWPLLAFPAQAQVPTAPAAPTLAQALPGAEPPKDTLLFTVAAEKVILPADAALPQKRDTATQTVQTYGRILREFGGVTAAAPPTMTVLNTAPGTPNPYDGMPPGDALKLLLAGLTDSQWKTLISPVGLGLSDLTGDTQPDLFLALFPGNSLKLYPRRLVDSYGGEDDAHLPSLSPSDIRQAHLRLGQRVTLGMAAGSGEGSYFNALGPSPGGLVKYEIYPGTSGLASPNTLFGVAVRAVIPNTPKPSDLAYDDKALQVRVNLAGVKTVGDLTQRLGVAVKKEIYADPRYETRSVTHLGLSSARAADLLQALALCVAGTYRKVGPAYVLTDDLAGEGTRQMILSRFVEAADLARTQSVTDAGDGLITSRGIGSLPPLDSALVFSAAQKAALTEGGYYVPGGSGGRDVPFVSLTPEQQAFARQSVETWNTRLDNMTEQEASAEDKAKLRVTLNRPVNLSVSPTLLMQTPSVSGAIMLDAYLSANGLFSPSDQLRAHNDALRWKAQMAAHPPPSAYVPPPAPPLGPLLARSPRRAVLVQPKTAKEVDAVIAVMKTVGFNQLWLDVFSNGKSHLDGSPDILMEAVKQTRGTGIQVFAVLSLLHWGPDAPPAAWDRTLLGETSPEADAAQTRYQAIKFQGKTAEEAEKLVSPADYSVCPVAPAVQETLLALVRRVAATNGVAGIVLRDTQASGYDRPDLSVYGISGGGPFGYATALRLAFLRRTHIDPVDLMEAHMNGAQSAGADTSLPDFDDYHVERLAETEWSKFRADAGRTLLDELYAAASPVPGKRPVIWIAQRRPTGRDDWYGLWAGSFGRLPEKPENVAYGGAQENVPAFAHTQCRADLYEMPAFAPTRSDLAYLLEGLPAGWDGFILNLSSSEGNPLAGLLPPAAKPH